MSSLRLATVPLLMLALVTGTPAVADTTIAGVASVIDGDTLEIHGEHIRLHGIDSPEAAQTCLDGAGTDYPCGREAAIALADRIGRAPVTCERRDRDRYNRTIAVCWDGDTNLNAWMVREGHALAYRRFSDDYVMEERAARSAGRGLWRGEFSRPWDWRGNR